MGVGVGGLQLQSFCSLHTDALNLVRKSRLGTKVKNQGSKIILVLELSLVEQEREGRGFTTERAKY